MKKKFKILDNNFAHAKYSTDYQESVFVDWDRSPVNENDKIVIYTDNFLQKVGNNSKVNIAWLMEPPTISPHTYKWIESNNNKFTYVLTYIKHLLDKGENYVFYPEIGCWIYPKDQKIYDKTKKVSIIASAKNWTTGHKLRHISIARFRNKMDVYGRGYNPVNYKLTALKDYMFSVTIENTKQDYCFTEKLIDCFVTGTVPIYWGCPSIGNFFNTDGMILFDKHEDLENILNNLSPEKYLKMRNVVQENFEKAKDYLISEDYIYKNYLSKYEL